jgi:hypothetical protein
MRVIRTLACDASNSTIVVANSAMPAIVHSADRSELYHIDLSKLKGWFSDTDVKFELSEDGRLKSVNATTTGEGETILKTAISIGLAAAVMMGFDGGRDYTKECALIKKAAGDKPLTITYEGAVDPTKQASDSQLLKPEAPTEFYATELASAIGGVCAFVDGTVAATVPAQYAAQNSDVSVQARQPGLVNIGVTAGTTDGCKGTDVWKGQLPVAQFGQAYQLPMPKPILFGKEGFGASFSDSGALTSLQYTSNTGAGQALNVINTALTGAEGETAQKAAAARAEADLIAQQQRVVQCKANPSSCK